MKSTIIVFFLSMTLFISCTKETIIQTPEPGNASIQGLWIGTYTVDGSSNLGQQYFSLVIKPDMTMIADTKWGTRQHLSPGTWSLADSTLSCTFTCVYGLPEHIGIVETTTAKWDKKGNLSGTWRNPAPLTGSGNITLSKVD